MSESVCYQYVVKMRDGYAKQLRSKKKNVRPFHCGMCFYLRHILFIDGYYADEVLDFIKRYGEPKNPYGYWFPCGKVKLRLDLMNKAIANYELYYLNK